MTRAKGEEHPLQDYGRIARVLRSGGGWTLARLRFVLASLLVIYGLFRGVPDRFRTPEPRDRPRPERRRGGPRRQLHRAPYRPRSGLWGTDQAASVEIGGFERLVRNIRDIELSLGDGVKRIYDSELASRQKLRRARVIASVTSVARMER
jgi:hypothetical protein